MKVQNQIMISKKNYKTFALILSVLFFFSFFINQVSAQNSVATKWDESLKKRYGLNYVELEKIREKGLNGPQIAMLLCIAEKSGRSIDEVLTSKDKNKLDYPELAEKFNLPKKITIDAVNEIRKMVRTNRAGQSDVVENTKPSESRIDTENKKMEKDDQFLLKPQKGSKNVLLKNKKSSPAQSTIQKSESKKDTRRFSR